MKISEELKAKVKLLKDRGDLDRQVETFPDLGIFSKNFRARVRQVKCVGVTESRQELLENKIKTNYYQEKTSYGI